jgi:hypothetical protein
MLTEKSTEKTYLEQIGGFASLVNVSYAIKIPPEYGGN